MEWEPIRLRWHKWELKGTLYFEFQPGVHAGRHWQPGSVYIWEEYVADLERLVAWHAAEYGTWSHYGVTIVSATQWHSILTEFEGLSASLRTADRVATSELMQPQER